MVVIEGDTAKVAVAVRFGLAGLVLIPALRGVTREELRAGAVVGTVPTFRTARV